MSNHSVVIKMLRTYNDRSWFGVDADDPGYLRVRTSIGGRETKTYLICMIDNFMINLFQFDDIDWAKDWVTKEQNYIAWIKEVCHGLSPQIFSDEDLPTVYIRDMDWLEELVLPDDHPMCPEIKERS